jgi:hypothetical protein
MAFPASAAGSRGLLPEAIVTLELARVGNATVPKE